MIQKLLLCFIVAQTRTVITALETDVIISRVSRVISVKPYVPRIKLTNIRIVRKHCGYGAIIMSKKMKRSVDFLKRRTNPLRENRYSHRSMRLR